MSSSEHDDFLEAARSKYHDKDDFLPVGLAFGPQEDDKRSVATDASLIADEVGDRIANLREGENKKLLDQYRRDHDYIILPPRQKCPEAKLLYRAGYNMDRPYGEILLARKYLWAFIYSISKDASPMEALKNAHLILNQWKIEASEKSKTLASYINDIIVPFLISSQTEDN